MAKGAQKSGNKVVNSQVEANNNEIIETVDAAEVVAKPKVEKEKLQDFNTLIETFGFAKEANQIMKFMVVDLAKKNKVNLKTYVLDLFLKMQQDAEFKEQVLTLK